MQTENAQYVYALSQLPGVGLKSVLQIRRVFPDPDRFLNASEVEVEAALGRQRGHVARSARDDHWKSAWQRAIEQVSRHADAGIASIAVGDSQYPPLLSIIKDPPLLLYVNGSTLVLTDSDAVAVIGTRTATSSGKHLARLSAKAFSLAEYVIVSGLAKGIDTAAHESTLEAGGRTVAVLGTPLNSIYPAENRVLAERIVSYGGAVISELPLGAPSRRADFVRRDRIQSGLSIAVLCIQAALHGGSIHTVKFAEAQGRLIYCPTPPDDESHLRQYAGTLELLRSGRAAELEIGEGGVVVTDVLRKHRDRLLTRSASPDSPSTQRRLDFPTERMR